MAVTGPLSAVGAAALPAAVGAVLGERLAPLGVVGVLLALPAIWLVASTGPVSDLRSGSAEGLLSGSGFALEFVGLSRAGGDAGLWPVAVSQSTALVLIGSWVVARRPQRLESGLRRWLPLSALAGGLSLCATALYFLAATHGQLTVAAVLAALYPGITVGLAAVLLRERPRRVQVLGMLIGAVAVTFVVAS
jgi:drug/metabolite transporter (DMT)-like permease